MLMINVNVVFLFQVLSVTVDWSLSSGLIILWPLRVRGVVPCLLSTPCTTRPPSPRCPGPTWSSPRQRLPWSWRGPVSPRSSSTPPASPPAPAQPRAPPSLNSTSKSDKHLKDSSVQINPTLRLSRNLSPSVPPTPPPVSQASPLRTPLIPSVTLSLASIILSSRVTPVSTPQSTQVQCLLMDPRYSHPHIHSVSQDQETGVRRRGRVRKDPRRDPRRSCVWCAETGRRATITMLWRVRDARDSSDDPSPGTQTIAASTVITVRLTCTWDASVRSVDSRSATQWGWDQSVWCPRLSVQSRGRTRRWRVLTAAFPRHLMLHPPRYPKLLFLWSLRRRSWSTDWSTSRTSLSSLQEMIWRGLTRVLRRSLMMTVVILMLTGDCDTSPRPPFLLFSWLSSSASDCQASSPCVVMTRWRCWRLAPARWWCCAAPGGMIATQSQSCSPTVNLTQEKTTLKQNLRTMIFSSFVRQCQIWKWTMQSMRC